MPAHSGQIAAAVDHFADLLEIEGAKSFSHSSLSRSRAHD
jgi:hypothetical protein